LSTLDTSFKLKVSQTFQIEGPPVQPQAYNGANLIQRTPTAAVIKHLDAHLHPQSRSGLARFPHLSVHPLAYREACILRLMPAVTLHWQPQRRLNLVHPISFRWHTMTPALPPAITHSAAFAHNFNTRRPKHRYMRHMLSEPSLDDPLVSIRVVPVKFNHHIQHGSVIRYRTSCKSNQRTTLSVFGPQARQELQSTTYEHICATKLV